MKKHAAFFLIIPALVFAGEIERSSAQEKGEQIAGVINVDMIGYQANPDNMQIHRRGWRSISLS